jgi:anti-anti-sigma factor
MTQRPSDIHEGLTVEMEHCGPTTVLRTSGTVDLATLDLFMDALRRLGAEVDETAVVDLAGTGFVACCAVRPLAALRVRLETTRRRLVLTHARPVVRRVLLACDLREVLAGGTCSAGPGRPPDQDGPGLPVDRIAAETDYRAVRAAPV